MQKLILKKNRVVLSFSQKINQFDARRFSKKLYFIHYPVADESAEGQQAVVEQQAVGQLAVVGQQASQ